MQQCGSLRAARCRCGCLCPPARALLLLLLLLLVQPPHEAAAAAAGSVPQQVGAQGAAAPAAAAAGLAQLLRNQQANLHLLQALQDGTFSAAAATQLLQDVARLRASLQPGGAATQRWQRLHGGEAGTAGQSGAGGAGQDSSASADARGGAQASRGILIVAGGHDQFRNAHILLRLLRHAAVACRLPVELVHYGPHELDAAAAAAMLAHAAATGTVLRIIDGGAVPPSAGAGLDPHPRLGRAVTGFKAKVHALVWVTSFRQVLLLDSDNTPLADPTGLFDSDGFVAHGALFWPDFWSNQWMQPAIYSLLGLDVPWEADPAGFRACEAGQVVLDRARHHDALEHLWLLNLHSNSGLPGAEQGVVGKCLWGDKDTYLLAFHLVGKAADFYSSPHMPLQALARPGGAAGSTLVHAGMVHRGPEAAGALLFLHRTAAGKFFPHCQAHGGASCRVWALTTPVDQRQLLASVPDPSAMALHASQVDAAWQEQHCAAGEEAAEEEGGGPDGGQCSAAPAGTAGQCGAPLLQAAGGGGSAATALRCDLDAAAGLLPIPVVAAQRLPRQVRAMLQAAQEAYTEVSSSQQQL